MDKSSSITKRPDFYPYLSFFSYFDQYFFIPFDFQLLTNNLITQSIRWNYVHWSSESQIERSLQLFASRLVLMISTVTSIAYCITNHNVVFLYDFCNWEWLLLYWSISSCTILYLFRLHRNLKNVKSNKNWNSLLFLGHV